MNKNQTVMASIGAVSLVATLTLGFLAFSGLDGNGETLRELESKRDEVRALKEAAVAPTEASVKAVRQNKSVIDAWCESALDLASRGDAAPAGDVRPPAFKQMMVEDARELARLPGGVDGNIARESQDFGFREFIREGKMPEETELPQLQRQWAEICFFVRTLSSCGAAELLSVAPVEGAKAKTEPSAQKPGARGAAVAGRRGKAVPETREVASSQKYTLSFRAAPASLTKVLNALAVATNLFVVVDSFEIRSAEDRLATVLGAGRGERQEAAPKRPGRRGAARNAAQPEAGEDRENLAKKGLVTDPAAAMLVATLGVSTYDFGTGAAKAAAETARNEGSPAGGTASGKEDAE